MLFPSTTLRDFCVCPKTSPDELLGVQGEPVPPHHSASSPTETSQMPSKEPGFGYLWGLVLLNRVWKLKCCYHWSPFSHTGPSFLKPTLIKHLKDSQFEGLLAVGEPWVPTFLVPLLPRRPASSLAALCGLGLSSPLSSCFFLSKFYLFFKAWPMSHLFRVSPASDYSTHHCFLSVLKTQSGLLLPSPGQALQIRVHEDGITLHFPRGDLGFHVHS